MAVGALLLGILFGLAAIATGQIWLTTIWLLVTGAAGVGYMAFVIHQRQQVPIRRGRIPASVGWVIGVGAILLIGASLLLFIVSAY